jgi:phosphoglucomutase
MKEMKAVVNGLKAMKVDAIGGKKVVAMRDYSIAKRYDYVSGKEEDLDIPACNCVYYEIEGGSFVCVRPSGTEPKLKIYYSIKDKDETSALAIMEQMQQDVAVMLEKAKN